LAWAKRSFLNYARFLVVSARLLRHVREDGLRARYKRQLRRVLAERWREPHILVIYALKVATHYHYAAIAKALARAKPGGDMPDAGRSFSRDEADGGGFLRPMAKAPQGSPHQVADNAEQKHTEREPNGDALPARHGDVARLSLLEIELILAGESGTGFLGLLIHGRHSNAE
jgi:hypothetical protein